MATETAADSRKSSSSADHGKRVLPPLYIWIIVVVCWLLVAVLRIFAPLDHAHVNLLTLVFGFISVVVPVGWFTLFSGAGTLVRLAPLTLILVVVAGFSSVFTIAHVSGEMRPYFRFRWSVAADKLLDDHRQLASRTDGADSAPAEIDLSQSTADDFPQFLGPDRDGSVANVTLHRDWTAHAPKLLWRQPIGAGWSSFTVVNGFAVTMEQRGSEEMVTCYRVSDGQLMWYHSVPARHEEIMGGPGPRGTPSIETGRVYAQGATGVLRCLDGATGKELWRVDLVERYSRTLKEDRQVIPWGRAGSPLVVGEKVIIPAGGPPDGPCVTLLALDKVTGDTVWEAGKRQISYCSPSLAWFDNHPHVVYVSEARVSGFDLDDGTELWNSPWPGHSNVDPNNSQAVILPGNRILLSKGYGGGAKSIQLVPTEQRWWDAQDLWDKSSVLKTKFTNVVVHKQCIFGLSDGILECVDFRSGERRWKRGRYGHGQILRVGDLLLVQAESGKVVMCEANPNRHVELGRFDAIEGKTWNNICLAGNRLMVRNANEAACYELSVRDER